MTNNQYLFIMCVTFRYTEGDSTMEITKIRIRVIENEGRMKAIASITLDDELAVHDIRIIEGNEGLFVAMPSRRTQLGEFRDVVHPINAPTRKKFEQQILAEYEQVIQEEATVEQTE